MTRRVYLLTEGVHDVTYFARILRRRFDVSQVKKNDQLEEGYRAWLGSFKWPHGEDISRLSVPAPEFYVCPERAVTIALVNALGIDNMEKKLFVDREAFARQGIELHALGVVLDSDDRTAEQSFIKMCDVLKGLDLPAPSVLGEFVAGPPSTGIFVLPDGRRAGTLEDVLVPLGRDVYRGLFAVAEPYVESMRAALDVVGGEERKELQKPSGPKKALLSAVSAVLKPGRAIQTTLQDHRWISKDTLEHPALAPSVRFVERLFAAASA
jgi:hypothetical protein